MIKNKRIYNYYQAIKYKYEYKYKILNKYIFIILYFNMDNNNKVNNTIFAKLLQSINNNKKLTVENIDFIESLSPDKKMEIILLYDKVIQANKKLFDSLLDTNRLK